VVLAGLPAVPPGGLFPCLLAEGGNFLSSLVVTASSGLLRWSATADGSGRRFLGRQRRILGSYSGLASSASVPDLCLSMQLRMTADVRRRGDVFAAFQRHVSSRAVWSGLLGSDFVSVIGGSERLKMNGLLRDLLVICSFCVGLAVKEGLYCASV